MGNFPPAPEIADQAQILYQKGRLEAAARAFNTAAEAFRKAEDSSKAAEMENNLSVVLLQIGQPQEALNAVKDTPSIFTQLGDEAGAAYAYGNLAAALDACEDLPAALAAYHEAASRFLHLGEAENHLHTIKAISRIHLRQGQILASLAAFRSGLDEQPRLNWKYRVLRQILKLPYRLLESR